MQSHKNATFCTQVGHFNPVYCGVSQQWTPRLSKRACGACVALPALFSVISTIAGIPLIWRHFNKLQLYEKQVQQERSKNKPQPRWASPTLIDWKIKFKVYILPILPLLWDSVDVILDGLYFYNLEQGKMISQDITRNTYVNNALLAFGILGSLKTPFLILLIGQFWNSFITTSKSDFTLLMVATSPTAIGDLYITILVYLTEDCALLFLEYFWIEKYMADHPSSIVVTRNLISGIISCMPLLNQFLKLKDRWYIADQIDNSKHFNMKRRSRKQHLKKEVNFINQRELMTKNTQEKSKRQKIYIIWIALSVISLIGNIGSFLRVIGSVYQIVTHKVNKSCLAVNSKGILYQRPFDDNCLRSIDYAILFFNFLPVLMYTFMWAIYTTVKIITTIYCRILRSEDAKGSHYRTISVNITNENEKTTHVSIVIDGKNASAETNTIS